ncbi:hypothetical protein V1524DRAFT_430522 [Lipomyces starkeyi]|jgi:hypothetical protein
MFAETFGLNSAIFVDSLSNSVPNRCSRSPSANFDMPIAKSLKKIEQKLKKKSAVHPKARKFKQLNRATLREAKINKRKQDREMARDGQGKHEFRVAQK